MTTSPRKGIRPISAVLSIAMAALQIILPTGAALAGKIFGKGVKVEIAGASKPYGTETDNYGSYRIYLPEKGKFTLTVHYRQQKPSIPVYSYDRSTRYDFSVERKDSLYVLKRK